MPFENAELEAFQIALLIPVEIAHYGWNRRTGFQVVGDIGWLFALAPLHTGSQRL